MKKSNTESIVRGAQISLLASLLVLVFALFANPIVVFLAYLVLASGIFWAGLVEIKPPNIGIVLYLGKRTELKLNEGIGWIIPGFETVQNISLAPITYEVGKDKKFQIDAIEKPASAATTPGAPAATTPSTQPATSTMLQMTVAYMVVIEVIEDKAELTLNISKEDLEKLVVQTSKQVVRHLGSISSYEELMVDQKQTEKLLGRKLTRLDKQISPYGYKRVSFTLSNMTPTDEGFKRAAEGQAREIKERQAEKTQQAHIREMAIADMEASKGPDGIPTLTYKEALDGVLMTLNKAKGIVIRGGENTKLLLSGQDLK